MKEPIVRAAKEAQSERNRVERSLQKFWGNTIPLDQAEVKASRDFHIEHWLRMAEEAIQSDHAASYYCDLSANIEQTISEFPEDSVPADVHYALLRDLAFMEGHIQAFRSVSELLKEARKSKIKDRVVQ